MLSPCLLVLICGVWSRTVCLDSAVICSFVVTSPYSLWKFAFGRGNLEKVQSLQRTKTIIHISLSKVNIWMRILNPIILFVCTVRTDNAVNDVCQGLENIQNLHCIVWLLAAAARKRLLTHLIFQSAAKVSS